jgi:drug/metabolite transporter (DMT)-like permease
VRATTTAVLWTLVSVLAFSTSNVLVRHLSTKLPPLEMAFFRAVAGLVLVVVAWRLLRDLRRLPDPHIHLLRAAVGTVSLMAMVHAYTSLPLALVTAVLYLRVLLVIPLGRIFLGERAEPSVWIAAGLGISGALIALWPRLQLSDTGELNWGVVTVLIAAVASSGSQICMRRLARTNPPTVVVTVSALLISLLIAIPASTSAIVPPAADVPLLIVMGLCSALAQWATVRAYVYAPPARLMPLTLIDIPLALAAGYLLFGEVLSADGLIGSVIIICAAMYVVRASRSESRGNRTEGWRKPVLHFRK